MNATAGATGGVDPASRCEVRELACEARDGHRFTLHARIPPDAHTALLWLPALGIAARHYAVFADALATRGIATLLHEWRGHGSSSLRAARGRDWGWRALLEDDLAASTAMLATLLPGARRLIGGHSLGGQLACCRLALSQGDADAVWLVGSGSPYWRAFPPRQRLWLPLAYRFLPWLARRAGYLPGRRIGFGGNEACGVIQDWAVAATAGRYAARGLDADLEAALIGIDAQIDAVVLADDWLAPAGSLHFLLSKMPAAADTVTVLDAAALGAPADHYAWMKQPTAVIDALLDSGARSRA